ncbi:MAG: DNA recombination protein RmuC, partial [Candidatus Rokubacteria bacterium]|nr:DNA recombination protein RmuC [Candidatus Rokubacteria bacterium]
EAARAEGRQGQVETLTAVRQELHQLRTEMTGQMGEVRTGVVQQLQDVNRVVGNVQGSLGKLGEATQRVVEVGKEIQGFEQILKSPKVRGGLGETLLENMLAQMLPREDYDLQYGFKSGEKVDAAIRIGGRIVPVDAKFPLENFRRMLAESEEDRRRAYRKAFGRDVKNRVEEIATKYILPDEGTFDFALMYVPAENVYYEMIVKDDEGEDESIASYALSRRVVPVSPNTLYAYLQVIILGLRGLRIEANAREIQNDLIRLGGDLDRIKEHFSKLSGHLSNAQKQFTDAERDLSRFEAKLEAIERKGDQAALPGPDA